MLKKIIKYIDSLLDKGIEKTEKQLFYFERYPEEMEEQFNLKIKNMRTRTLNGSRIIFIFLDFALVFAIIGCTIEMIGVITK